MSQEGFQGGKTESERAHEILLHEYARNLREYYMEQGAEEDIVRWLGNEILDGIRRVLSHGRALERFGYYLKIDTQRNGEIKIAVTHPETNKEVDIMTVPDFSLNDFVTRPTSRDGFMDATKRGAADAMFLLDGITFAESVREPKNLLYSTGEAKK